MFKGLRNGRRNASPTGQTGRVHGLMALRGSDISLSQRRRPAFMPDTPQQQTYDSKTSRVSEISG